MWAVVRAIFYLWFSIAAGFLAVSATYASLGSLGPSYPLPGGGWPLVISLPAFILASLVLSQLSHFGQRISLRKWIPLCVVATLLMFAAAVSGL